MRANRSPALTLIPLIVIAAIFHFVTPQFRAITWIAMIGGGVLLCINIGMSLLMNLWPSDVPALSVKELVHACVDSPSETGWKLVEFKPTISLEEIRIRLNDPAYDQERRIANFDSKFRIMSELHPDVVVFYSREKGLAAGNVRAVGELVGKYGKWTIDNWNSLIGAAKALGMRVHCLDGSQTVPTSMLR